MFQLLFLSNYAFFINITAIFFLYPFKKRKVLLTKTQIIKQIWCNYEKQITRVVQFSMFYVTFVHSR